MQTRMKNWATVLTGAMFLALPSSRPVLNDPMKPVLATQPQAHKLL